MNLAPIILFVYNRPWHTRQTVEALQANDLANQSDLIIFSDAPKNEDAVEQVSLVREYIKTVLGFNSVRIVERKENWGLAKSIIEGVTETVNQYGKVIVLEDDIVTSPAFLQFMNQALEFYEKDKKVWHISGWSYPIETHDLGDVFFWRVMNCWGWATWADRWSHFDKDPQRLISEWSVDKKRQFDLDNSGIFWPQVKANAASKLNTWAIFWYSTIFENDGLCLNPVVSYVDNIGHDGSGTNCGDNKDSFSVVLGDNLKIQFPSVIVESDTAINRVSDFYKKQKKAFLVRAVNKLSRMTLGKNIL